MFPRTTFRRRKRLAAAVLFVMLIPLLFLAALRAPGRSDEPSTPSSPGRNPLADLGDELRYQLWKHDLASARDPGEMHDWVYRLVFESAGEPEPWRESDPSDATMESSEATIPGDPSAP